jgi:hypothetical protein
LFHFISHFFPLQGIFNFVTFTIHQLSYPISMWQVPFENEDWPIIWKLCVLFFCIELKTWPWNVPIYFVIFKKFNFYCFFGLKHYNCCSNIQCYLSYGVPTIAFGVIVVCDVDVFLIIFDEMTSTAYLRLPLVFPFPHLDPKFLCHWWFVSITRDCNKEIHN